MEDLVSLPSGPLAKVERVAQEPTPEMDADAMLGLLSVGRESFVKSQ